MSNVIQITEAVNVILEKITTLEWRVSQLKALSAALTSSHVDTIQEWVVQAPATIKHFPSRKVTLRPSLTCGRFCTHLTQYIQ